MLDFSRLTNALHFGLYVLNLQRLAQSPVLLSLDLVDIVNDGLCEVNFLLVNQTCSESRLVEKREDI